MGGRAGHWGQLEVRGATPLRARLPPHCRPAFPEQNEKSHHLLVLGDEHTNYAHARIYTHTCVCTHIHAIHSCAHPYLLR